MGTHVSLSARISGNNFLRYSVAIFAVVAAAAICALLSAWIAPGVAYVILFPAIAFSAWYCGVGPTVLAIVLALAGEIYGLSFKIHPVHYPTRAEWIGS